MKKANIIIAGVLIAIGVVNAIFALLMLNASKDPTKLITSIQESRIDDLVHTEGYKEKTSQVSTIYLIVSIGVIGLGIFALFYLQKLSITLFPTVQIKFGETFMWSERAGKEKKSH